MLTSTTLDGAECLLNALRRQNDMESPSLTRLPVELQTLILKYLLADSHRSTTSLSIPELWSIGRTIYYGPEVSPHSRQTSWIEQDLHATLLFPFNVAAVCRLWQDIAVRIPEYWSCVVFDIANDPTPFLDAFSWSKNLEKIEVFVFNSTSNAQDVDKDLEKARVATITQALKPHIHRCKFIISHLTYSSSLPPPNIFLVKEAPHLEDLTLDCRINDIELTHRPPGETSPWLSNSFPMLETLSLTGFWFFYLADHSHLAWLEGLKCAQYMSLHISQFTFTEGGNYSLDRFLDHLTAMEALTSIYFTDISLDYLHDYSASEPELVYPMTTDIYFDHVSKDFIAQFNANTNIEIDECLSFKNCEIPNFAHDLGGNTLLLENIIDTDDGQNLRNIVNNWGGSEIIFNSCSSLNDNLLSWLASERNIGSPGPSKIFPANGLMFLSISDCPNFSPPALQRLIEVRMVDDYQEGLTSVNVTDSRNVLSDGDKEWFKENSGRTHVRWYVRNADGSNTSHLWSPYQAWQA